MSNEEQMRAALSGLLDRYVELVNSGDAGNWNPETEQEVIAARDALSNFASKRQEIDALNQQVLELSAQVEVMREALQTVEEYLIPRVSNHGITGRTVVLPKVTSTLSIPPSAALSSHDNEVAAKALEEAANEVESEIMYPNARQASWKYNGLNDAANGLRRMATEWRNRK